MSGIGPGWYDDGRGQERWWNGISWSESTRPRATAAPFVAPTAAPVVQPTQPSVHPPTQAQTRPSFAPGWYDDGSGTQRWWDGAAWTQHVQYAGAGLPPYATAPEYTSVRDFVGTGESAQAASAAPDPDAPDSAVGDPFTPGPAAPQLASAGQALAGQPVPWQPSADEPWGGVQETPQRRSGGRLVAAAVAAVVVIGLAIAGILLINATVNAPGTGTPRGAVLAYDAAWRDADCEAFTDVTTGGFRARYYPDCEAFATAVAEVEDGYDIDIVESDITGDRASIVTIEGWSDENTWKMEYSLVRERDDWRIMDIVEVR